MSHDTKFKPGDVVRLTSGGPLMTVVQAKANEVVTQWHDGEKFVTGEFSPPEVLMPAMGPPVT